MEGENDVGFLMLDQKIYGKAGVLRKFSFK